MTWSWWSTTRGKPRPHRSHGSITRPAWWDPQDRARSLAVLHLGDESALHPREFPRGPGRARRVVPRTGTARSPTSPCREKNRRRPRWWRPVAEHRPLSPREARTGAFVEHLFRGLAFRYGRYLLPPGGHAEGQAEVSIPAVVMADGTRHVALTDCEIDHTGVFGVWFRCGCRDCRSSTALCTTWGRAASASASAASRPAERPDRRDRRGQLHHRGGGRIFPGCVGVRIGQSATTGSRTTTSPTSFTPSISVGWRGATASPGAGRT